MRSPPRAAAIVAAPAAAGSLSLGQACSGDDDPDRGAGGAVASSVQSSSAASSTAASSGGAASSSSGAPDCGDLGFNHGACSICASRGCCAELQACATGTPCGGYLKCVQGCALGDPACEASCANAHPDGLAESAAMTRCLGNHCPEECPTKGYEVCDSTIGYADLQCAQCLSDRCCREYVACVEPDVLACILCVNGTGPCNAEGEVARACRYECAVECGLEAGAGGAGGGGGAGGAVGSGGAGGATGAGGA